MKQLIKYILKKLGYELRPIQLNGASNSIDYNHLNNIDAFYSNGQLTQDYIKNNVPVHIKNLFTLLETKKMDLGHKTVIDVGCGTGHVLKELNIRYPNATLEGTEFSEAAINVAHGVAPGIPLTRMDITIESTGRTYDLVLCQQVLEHIMEAERAVKNLWNMTSQGGHLIITIPDGRLDSFSGHIHFWSKEGFTLFIKKCLSLTRDVEVEQMQDGKSLYALVNKL